MSKIEKLVTNYFNNVYSVFNRKSAKHEGETFQPKSIRTLNRQWKTTSTEYRCVGVFPISSLFDIGSNMESLKGSEKVFYHGQQFARICRLSEEVDEDWVKEQLAMLREQGNIQECVQAEKDCESEQIDEIDVQVERNDFLNQSFTRSGKVRKPTEDISCQTEVDFDLVPAPKIRKHRKCLENVKSACVQVSVDCGISTALVAKAVQIVCSVLYEHQYYISKEEALEKDPSLASYREAAGPAVPPKKTTTFSESCEETTTIFEGRLHTISEGFSITKNP